jgi:hypothetical protein
MVAQPCGSRGEGNSWKTLCILCTRWNYRQEFLHINKVGAQSFQMDKSQHVTDFSCRLYHCDIHVTAQNLLGCTTVFLIGCRPTFQRCVLPPSSGRWRRLISRGTHLWNVSRYPIKNTAVHPRRFWPSYSPPWELEISTHVTFGWWPTKSLQLINSQHSPPTYKGGTAYVTANYPVPCTRQFVTGKQIHVVIKHKLGDKWQTNLHPGTLEVPVTSAPGRVHSQLRAV